MSDRIFLEALEIEGVIGIYDWERKTKQVIRIDLEMPANAEFASGSDTIEDTLNYKDVAKLIIGYVEQSSYMLVETLAENIAQLVLSTFKVEWIELSVSKPTAIRGSKNVGVKVIRGVHPSMHRRTVYLSLGSNIDPHEHLNKTIALLTERFGSLCQSTTYQNKAVGFEGEDFLNLVVGFDSNESLNELKNAFTLIEDQCGRERGAEKFSPRTIDIDLLLYGDVVVNSGSLRLPRPEILKFPFMLRPLAELAGNVRHPTLGKTFAQVWKELAKSHHEMQPVNL